MEQSEKMTFEKLHEGIECDCLSFDGVAENPIDVFVRLVSNEPVLEDDFRSYHEEKIKLRASGHQNICNHRGVSMNKVDATNEAIVKEALTDQVKIKPKLPPMLCKFKIGPMVGMVWYKPSSTPYTGDSHHNLLKCDQFDVNNLQIIEIIPLR